MEDEKLIFSAGFSFDGSTDDLVNDFKSIAPAIEKKLPALNVKLAISEKEFNKLEAMNERLKAMKIDPINDNAKNSITELVRNLSSLEQVLKRLDNYSQRLNKASASGSAVLKDARTIEVQERTAQRQVAANAKLLRDNELLRKQSAQAEMAELRLAKAKEKTLDVTKRQNVAFNDQASYVSRLVQRMALYFSIGQALSFVKQVREVTAEFELQRVALGALIQDSEKASILFNQIKAAAVQSPFQIKDLVTYTKQLAAYRIEQESLFEWTQRLADISAGLGVGMERLILAFGQVRATGYLRQSEVRQFTEAGIPIVEALTERLSKMNNRLVSTGEVFDMISKRGISFKQVEEVFRDLTDAGGMFYDMQAKQAKSLAGQWSNLIDVMNIAQAEMGESFRDEIEGGLSVLKELWENWETVAQVIRLAAAALGSYLLVDKYQQKRISLIGQEAASRLKNLEVMYKEEQQLAKLNALAGKKATPYLMTNDTLMPTAQFPDAVKMAETSKDLTERYIGQAVATGRLTKEQALLAIASGNTTKAQRAAIVSSRLLTQEQVKLAASSVRATSAAGVLRNAMYAIGTAAKWVGRTMKTALISSGIGIGLVLLGEAFSFLLGVFSKSKLDEELEGIDNAFKELNQTMVNTKNAFNDAVEGMTNTSASATEMKKSFSDASTELEKVRKILRSFKAEGLVDFSNITPDNIGEIFREAYGVASNIASYEKNFAIAVAEAAPVSFNKLTTTLEKMNKLTEDVYMSGYENVFNNLQNMIQNLNLSPASEQGQLWLDKFLLKQGEFETQEEYAFRLVEAYGRLFALDKNNQPILQTQEGVLVRFEDLFKNLTTTENEFIDGFNKSLKKLSGFDVGITGGVSFSTSLAVKQMKEDFEAQLGKSIEEMTELEQQQLVLGIRTYFADPENEFNEWSQKLGLKAVGEGLGLDMTITPKFELPVDEMNQYQLLLKSTGKFTDDEIAKAVNQQAAIAVVNNRMKQRNDIIENNVKADKKAYEARMSQLREQLLLEKEAIEKRLSTMEAPIPGVSSEGYTREYNKQISELSLIDQQLAKTAISFEEYTSANDKYIDTIEEEIVVLNQVGSAIGAKNEQEEKANKAKIDTLNSELQVLKEVYAKYQEYLKLSSPEEAQEKINSLYGNLLSNLSTIDIDPLKLNFSDQELVEFLEQFKKMYNNLGESEKALLLGVDIEDISLNRAIERIKEQINNIQEEIDTTQLRADFFKDILDATGDKKLAKSLTDSLYGSLGEVPKGQILDSIKGQLKAAFEGIDISQYIEGDVIDYAGLSSLTEGLNDSQKELAEDLIKNGREVRATEIKEMLESLKIFRSFEDQKLAIQEKGLEERKKISQLQVDQQEKDSLLKASQAKEDKEILELEIKHIKDLQIAFGNLNNLSRGTLLNTIEVLRESLKGITDPDQIKLFTDQINQAQDELDSRDFTPTAGSIEDLIAIYKRQLRYEEEIAAAKKEGSGYTETDIALIESYLAKSQEDMRKGMLSQGINYFVEGLQKAAEIMKEIAEISGDDSLEDLADNLSEAADILGAAAEGYASTGSWIGAVIGGVSSIIQKDIEMIGSYKIAMERARISAEDFAHELSMLDLTLDESKFSEMFGEQTFNKAAESYRNAQEAMRLYNEMLAETTETEIPELEYDRFGIATPESIARLDAYNRGLTDIEGMLINLTNYSGWQKFRGFTDEFTTLKDLAPEIWEDGIFNVENAEAFLNTNEQLTEEQKKQIQQVIDYAEAYEEAMQQIDDAVSGIFGDLASDLTDVIWNSVAAGSSAWDGFKEIGSEAIAALGKQMLQEFLLTNYLDQYRDQMRDAFATESPEEAMRDIIHSILGGMEGMINASQVMTEEWQKWMTDNGYTVDGETSGLTGISKEFGQASEEAILGLAHAYNTNNFYTARMDQNIALILSLLQTSSLVFGKSKQTLTEQQDLYLSALPTIAENTQGMLAECKAIALDVKRTANLLDAAIKPTGVKASKAIKTA